MMEAVFTKILQMSLMGCYSIGLVLMVRLLLMRCGRVYAYYLWVLVFVCLCLPVSLPGNYSLIPRQVAEFSLQDHIGQKGVLAGAEEQQDPEQTPVLQLLPPEGSLSVRTQQGSAETDISDGIPVQEEGGPDGTSSGADTPETQMRGEDRAAYLKSAERIWLLGVVLLMVCLLFSTCRMFFQCARYRRSGRKRETRVVETDGLPSPFLWGFLRPVIYLPSGMEEEEREYILAHEMVHRERRDHLVRFLILAVTILHWFNPLVWLARSLCCKDMEISCDETVLDRTEKNIRKAYAASLLKYAARQNHFMICPPGFGEPSVKSRIRNVLHHRKKSIWISAAAGLCVSGIAVGLLHYPAGKEGKNQKDSSDDSYTEAELLPEGDELQTDAQEGLVLNNGGEVLRAAGDYYYIDGLQLYSDGQAIYTSSADDDGTWHVYQYEPDGSGYQRVLDGRIVDSTDDGKVLYCMLNQEEEAAGRMGWYDTQTGSGGRFSQEGADYLGRYGGFLYMAEQKADGLHLNRVREIDFEEETDLLGEGIPAEEIVKLYADEGRRRLVFAAGGGGEDTESSEILCYSFDLDSRVLICRELTGLPHFAMMDGYLYFQRQRSREDGTMELFRTDYDFSEEEQVGEGLTLLCTEEETHTLLAEKQSGHPDDRFVSSLVRILPDEKEEQILLDMEQMLPAADGGNQAGNICLDWEFHAGDRIAYDQLNLLDGKLYVTVRHLTGRSWETDTPAEDPLEETHLTVSRQGEIGIWEPKLLMPGWEDDSWKTAYMVGQPVDPETDGWDLEHVIDIRDHFAELPDVPEASDRGKTYLLGETKYWTLYGKGDYRSMLLARNGRYTKISYPYMSGSGILPELMETDLDHDVITELAIVLRANQGDEYPADTLLAADFQNNGSWVYQFLDEDIARQLTEHAAAERTEYGQQVRFSFDKEAQRIQICADPEFYGEGNSAVTPQYNGSSILADVIWDGEHFILKNADCTESEKQDSGTEERKID